MQVNKLKCVNFRNIEQTEIEPCQEMNVIYGENAQGKTNLLEAIWLFTGAKSFRSAKDSAFLKNGSSKGYCELDFSAEGTEYNARMEFDEKRTAFLNQKILQSPARLAGKFNAVVFSPADLSLVTDGPAVRRHFIDLAIGQLYPAYINILRDYTRAVTQRNQIIKEYKYDASVSIMLDVFEQEIAQKGKKIIDHRRRYLERLKEYIPEIYYGLSSGKEKICAEYICCCEGDDLQEKLIESRKEDMYSAVTSVGPHRDDISLTVNDMNARGYGSQGQKRSIALSIKLAQAEVINKIVGESPVCLLDDVMSELDPSRQNYILNHIRGRQSFLSCCDPSNCEGLKEGTIFKVENGYVRKE